MGGNNKLPGGHGHSFQQARQLIGGPVNHLPVRVWLAERSAVGFVFGEPTAQSLW